MTEPKLAFEAILERNLLGISHEISFSGKNLPLVEDSNLLLASSANDLVDESAGNVQTKISRLLLVHLDQFPLLYEK